MKKHKPYILLPSARGPFSFGKTLSGGLPLSHVWRARFIIYPAFLSSLTAVLVLGALCYLGPVYRQTSLVRMDPGPAYLHRPHYMHQVGSSVASAPRPELPPLAQRQKNLWPLVRKLARKHGLDPALVMAVIQVESRFNPHAVSPKGAQGLMQIVPNTADHLGLDDPMDPEANLEAGVRYLAQLKKRFGGDIELTLAAYNAGPTKVKSLGAVPDHIETKNYLQKVLRKRDKFRSSFQTLALK